MKKLFKAAALLTAAVMLLAGCNGGNAATAAPEEATAVIQPAEPMEMRDISSLELVKEMKIGWSLGNTLDATAAAGTSVSATEKAWGNPITTQEMIDTVRDAGFNVIRLPVTWESHMADDGSYTVDPEWMARIKEVVDYCYNDDMFVILNMHHEDWLYPSAEKEEAATKQLIALWTQISETFKNYDEHLIFEGMNEPRLKGTDLEWTGGDEESRAIINRFAAAFIKTVRESGGNNALRHLMIPGYAASSDPAVYKEIVLPEDDDKLIVSIHAYIPYSFALKDNGSERWLPDRESCIKPIDELMDGLTETFTSKGRAVIIGEFGARDRDNLEYRVEWAKYYVNAAKEHGIVCCWWDNNAFLGGERFGLLKRTTLYWNFPELIEALMSPFTTE